MKSTIMFFSVILSFVSCANEDPETMECSSEAPTHEIFNELLQKHVSSNGEIDYRGFISDSLRLNDYLSLLESNHPTKKWSDNERLAYWINAYNAFTIRLIIRNYPVSSIKNLGGSIYKVNTAWDIKFIKICDVYYDLNNIEHQKIRKQFNEPRIHFAVNCASVSCPKLFNEAFVPLSLDEQLERVTREFINNPEKNQINSEAANISKIFSWYSGDFKQKGESVHDFINAYAEIKITDKTKVSYMDYDWKLNDID